MMAAFTSMMLLVVSSVAIDTTSMVQKNGQLQDYLDSAVLAAASSGETKKNKLKKIVKDSLEQNSGNNPDLKFKVKVINDEIVATASTVHKTSLMGIVGVKELPINVKSASPVAQELPVNLALVLDSTQSMAGSNMSDLQDAAKTLVEVMEKTNNPDTRISVVPFNSYVNVGMSRRSVGWMDVPADGPGPARSCYAEQTYTKTGCTTVPTTGYNDGVPYATTHESGCTTTATPTGATICPPPDNLVWNGCAGSRIAPDNLLTTANASNPIPGAMNESCGEELLPLTNNMDDVKDKIDAMVPTGNTYLPSGLIWGWRTLSPTSPFTEAASSPTKMTRALVLMTDGANTMSQGLKSYSSDPVYHRAYHPSDTTADNKAKARIEALCENVKADGITIFTVAYKLPAGSAAALDVLEACASNPSLAFEAKNTKQLKRTFKDIGKNLQVVRLSK